MHVAKPLALEQAETVGGLGEDLAHPSDVHATDPSGGHVSLGALSDKGLLRVFHSGHQVGHHMRESLTEGDH